MTKWTCEKGRAGYAKCESDDGVTIDILDSLGKSPSEILIESSGRKVGLKCENRKGIITCRIIKLKNRR